QRWHVTCTTSFRRRVHASEPPSFFCLSVLAAAGSAEAFLVALLEFSVGAPEVAARRRDVLLAREPLRERNALFLRPGRDRGVAKPVRRDVLGQAGSGRRLGDDVLRHLHAHAVRTVDLPPPGHKQRRILVLARTQVALEEAPRDLVQEDLPVAAALAEHRDLVRDPDPVRRRRSPWIERE